ncbi:MAG: FkbM family methyltransferase [Bacteroidota bacterium]|nr:FkbM family methyltransferase [Bacteroidota bacterium]
MNFYIRKKIYKLIYLVSKYLLKPDRPIKSIYGIYLTPSFQDVTFKYCFKGTYGTFFSHLLEQQKKKSIFIDIGANQGLYSILAGKNPCFEKIIAFEPSLKTAKLLHENLLSNKIENCQVVEAAISDKCGEFKLSVVRGHSGISSLRETKNTTNTYELIQTINHKQLNEIVPKHKNYIVKIDVEGYENIVINEITKCTFFDNVNYLFCEIDENWVDVDQIKNKLTKFGFTSFEKIGNNKKHYDLMISKKNLI